MVSRELQIHRTTLANEERLAAGRRLRRASDDLRSDRNRDDAGPPSNKKAHLGGGLHCAQLGTTRHRSNPDATSKTE